VGPENAGYVSRAAGCGDGPVICAWGTHGAYRNQDLVALRRLAAAGVSPLAYGTTRAGHPRHPLYIGYGEELMPFAGRKT
jgi:hypothetical protein